MFKKILIADDIDSTNLGLIAILKKFPSCEVNYVPYCDKAYSDIVRAYQDNVPFDLLISDLSFIKDSKPTKYESGEELIEAVKKVQPDLKVVVYSSEDRAFKIRMLFEGLGINAYIFKGREGTKELEEAIQKISEEDSIYISPHLSHTLKGEVYEIDDLDIKLLKKLSQGVSQEDISIQLQEEKYKPSSISSIEKRINKLKLTFKANNIAHLVSIAKDMGQI